MQISWVYASTYQPNILVDTAAIKSIGPSWGSWRTWKNNQTDNVVCSDSAEANALISKAFHAVCNFYVARDVYLKIGSQPGLKAYDGEYNHPVHRFDDIISLHLASQTNSIILMLGFDLGLGQKLESSDQVEQLQNYHGLMRSLFQNNPTTQYVLVDHAVDLGKHYQELPNLTCDIMENVLQLLTK
jgi:hypothetical protein